MLNHSASLAVKPEKRLALVSFNSLGDSLLYIMMAQNLQQNGYQLTLFGDIPFQLRDWLPQLEIKPYPDEADFEQAFDDYAFTIISPPRFIRKHLQGDLLERLRRKWLMICHKAPSDWQFDHANRLRTTLPVEQWQHFEPLARATGSIYNRKFKSESVVEMVLSYLQNQMGLEQVSSRVALTPPEELQHRKFRNRILVSPDSAWPEKKDWSPKQFIKLCHLLVTKGYEPVIVVAPNNYQAWETINAGRYLMPKFATIAELAAFIYESGTVIANDSGNGHLASFLDVPTVTIYRKRNPQFHWRPAWGRGVVVCPGVVLPGIRGPIWRPFISPQKVVSALQSLLQDELPVLQSNRV